MKKIVYLSLFLSSTAMATALATPLALPISTNVTTASAAISNQEVAEFDRLREKWREQMTGNSQATSLDVDVRAKFEQVHRAGLAQWQRMEKMEKSEQRTFLWQDQAQLGRKSEQLYSHYTRLKQMALAYASEGSALAGNPELLADLRSALQWLYQKNFYSPQTRAVDNWWHWEIGIPKTLAEIMILLHGHLSEQEVENYLASIDHFLPDPRHNGHRIGKLRDSVGANLVDTSLAFILSGILAHRSDKLVLARDALSPVFEYVEKGDGFYADGSFIQHVAIPYTFSYGNVLLDGVAKLMQLLKDSPWQIQDPKQANVYQSVYQAYEPLLYQGLGMDMVRGRAISREGAPDYSSGHSVMASIALLAQAAPEEHALRFKAMLKAWMQAPNAALFYQTQSIASTVLMKQYLNDVKIMPRAELILHKNFTNMDRVVHLRPGFAFGLSLFSKRTLNYEDMNLENRKGWYTAEGMTYLYNADTSAYSDGFWATVNPYRLAGTTVDTQVRADGSGEMLGKHAWVGGAVLDQRYGVAGMQVQAWNSSLRAKKSWFMFDDEVVCLGTDISSEDARTVESIVENRKLQGDGNTRISVNGKALSLEWGNQQVQELRSVHVVGSSAHSDMGFYFPQASSVHVLREQRTGKWSDINGLQGSNKPLTRPYFTLWFDHGKAPQQAEYAYVLLPNFSAQNLAAYVAKPDIQILQNTPQVQAVIEKNLGILAANFWEDQVATVDYLSSAQKAAVLVQIKDRQMHISVADPTQENQGVIELSVQKKISAVISHDPEIQVLQTQPYLKLAIHVKGARGRSFAAKFALNRK